MITKKLTTAMLVVCALVLAIESNVTAQEKKLGRHTVAEWHTIIDTTWGPGLPTSTKLEIFNFFWDKIDQEYSGFPYLDVNMWDSLRAVYRPQVEAGVSRGRLSAIMNKLSFSLQDLHAWIVDGGVNGFNAALGPVYTYGPGAPLFWPSGTGACGVFGAALTPLPDSSLLVYRAMNAHPLELVPGDVVLGYDGIPWRALYKEILAAEFPLGWGGQWGTTPRSMTHSLLTSAGVNWGLFDTVDVVKYATGDTVHLPTAPLSELPWEGLWGSEQLPVSGVRLPNFAANEWLTYGVIEGTAIGYVYCAQWSQAQVTPFRNALADLVKVKKVTGLILDCRFNVGGDMMFSPDPGLDLLFNENPAGATRWQNALRIKGTDRFAFSRSSPFDASVVMQPDYYDRPIAVLMGPSAASMGDMHSFRLRFHPMVRSFGLPTNGAFCVPEKFANNIFPMVRNPLWGTWWYMVPLGQMESSVNNEGLLMHKGFRVDEEVWLTRDGVAKGEDDVVKRALGWITTVTHAHDIALNRYYGKPGEDSVTVTAVLANPLSHEARVSAVVTDGAVVHDSVLLYNDGLHGDGSAGDSLWGARLLAPLQEGTFALHLQTDDMSEGSSRRLKNAAFLTTAGPLVLDTMDYLDHRADGYCEVQPYVKNTGLTAPFVNPTIALSCIDSGVTSIVPAMRSFYTIAAGASLASTYPFIVYYQPDKVEHDSINRCIYLNLTISLGLNSHACWDSTFRLVVSDPPVGVAEEEGILPTTYALEQNYPNPFNPRTVVRSQTPEASDVRIVIYDVLGREVKILVNERRAAGYYEDSFDASGLATGVYIYRLTAGSFTQSRKMILAK